MKPEPGIYEDIAPAEYFAWEAVSNSRLGRMALSPLHYSLEQESGETASMRLGSLVHSGRLEPLSVPQLYAVLPKYEESADNVSSKGVRTTSKVTSYYKAKKAEFEELHANKTIVDEDQYDRMVAMVRSLCKNELANEAINGKGPVESSIVWVDEPSGVLCKARIDKVNHDKGYLVDLKTTARLDNFATSIARYGYARQMAHYQEGWAHLTGELLTPWIIPVESSAPFCCLPAPLGEESLQEGVRERRRLIDRVAECQSTGVWPAPEPPKSWNMPAWALDTEPVAITVGGVTLEI